MPQARDEAGNIWEVDEQGNPVRLVQPARASAGRVVTLPPSPEKIAQEARQAAAEARASRSEARADRAEQRASAPSLPAGFRWKDGIVGGEAERIPGADSVGGKPPTEYQAKSAGFLGRLMEAERMFSAVPEGSRDARTVPGQWFHEAMPGVENSFNSADRQKADQAARNFIAASLRQESGAAISAGEFDNQYKIFFPMPGDGPEVIKQKAEARRQAIEGFKIAAGPLAAQVLTQHQDDSAAGKADQHADNEVPGQITGGLDKPPPGTDGGPPDLPPANYPGGDQPSPVAPASGGSRLVDRPEIASLAYSMMRAGAGYATIKSALGNKDAQFTLGMYNDAKKRLAADPNANPFSAQQEVPLTLMQRAAGSAPGTFAAQMANSATAGIPAYLAGDKGQGAIDAMQEMHPTASTLGSLTGGITGALGGEAALAARAPVALAKYVPRLADALYGGVSGYTGSGGDLGDAALGAIAAPIAGKAGEAAMRGAGAVAKGVTDPSVQYLRDLNIPLTAGQAAGGFLKSVEDKATSIPLIGDIINNRRREGIEAFNREAMGRAGEPIGFTPSDIGKAGVDQLYGAAGNAYDQATAGANVPLDGQFISDMGAFGQAADALPDDLRVRAAKAIQNRVAPISDAGVLTGESYQQAIRGLKGYKAETPKPGFEQDYRDALTLAQDALTEQMNRGGGAHVVEGLGNANAAYRGIKTIDNAANRADGAGYVFTPSQLQDALKVTNRKFPGSSPLNELADQGQAVLPSRIADSGTPGRAAQMIAAGALGGAGTGYATGDTGAGTGLGLGATLALALGGSKAGQRILTKMLTDRPAAARQVGDFLQRRAQVGGGFGAGILTPLLVGPQN